MKTKKYIFILFLLLFFTSSCSFITVEKVFTKSYILSYFEYDSFSLKANGNAISISNNLSTDGYTFKTTGSNLSKYNDICVANNDVSYNKYVSYWHPGPIARANNVFWANDIKKIVVVSDKDFDNNHPAGTPLDDLMTLYGASPRKFIDSGYKDRYDWNNVSESFKLNMPEFINYVNLAKPNPDDNPDVNPYDYTLDYYPIEMKLSQINPGDLNLLWLEMRYLVFDSQPTQPGSYLLTVSLFLNNGRVMRNTITKVFE